MLVILALSLDTSKVVYLFSRKPAHEFYSTMDNGFLLLNHVKIPHVNMLARFSSVDPKTNKYVKPASASLG